MCFENNNPRKQLKFIHVRTRMDGLTKPRFMGMLRPISVGVGPFFGNPKNMEIHVKIFKLSSLYFSYYFLNICLYGYFVLTLFVLDLRLFFGYVTK